MASDHPSKPDPEPPSALPGSTGARSFNAFVVLVRVGFVIVAWLVVFLMTFLGYLTLPAVVLFSFLLLYALYRLGERWMKRLRSRG